MIIMLHLEYRKISRVLSVVLARVPILPTDKWYFAVFKV